MTLVQLSFDFYMLEAKPENLIGDKAYDSDALDESLKEQGVEMIAPHRSNRTLKTTQDGRRPSARALKAALAGRTVFRMAAMERRLVVRWEYYTSNSLGFVELACITMLLKRI